MKLRDFPLLADQNIHADVVAYLWSVGFDITDVVAEGLVNESDETILAHTSSQGRIVVTHDADFGTLAVPTGAAYIGILYLRPGHVGPGPTIDSLQQLLRLDPELIPPFIAIVKRTATQVLIRLRQVSP